jgi:hypothetical protein
MSTELKTVAYIESHEYRTDSFLTLDVFNIADGHHELVLRSEAQAAVDSLEASLREARAETERMREVLAEIDRLCFGARFIPFFDAESEVGDLIHKLKETARAALTPGETNGR